MEGGAGEGTADILWRRREQSLRWRRCIASGALDPSPPSFQLQPVSHARPRWRQLPADSCREARRAVSRERLQITAAIIDAVAPGPRGSQPPGVKIGQRRSHRSRRARRELAFHRRRSRGSWAPSQDAGVFSVRPGGGPWPWPPPLSHEGREHGPV